MTSRRCSDWVYIAPVTVFRVAREVARLGPGAERTALAWTEAVSEFDEPDAPAPDATR